MSDKDRNKKDGPNKDLGAQAARLQRAASAAAVFR
jgi:hypothetical protein